MYPRHITSDILRSLADTPVVFLAGPRQVGKSTLAQSLARGPFPASYLTLDDLSVLYAARADPTGFVQGLKQAAVLDEVQRAGDLLLAIKASVDRDRRPGRFLLTGSANVLTLPRVADALVGRMAVHHLWPLSQGELAGVREDFIAAAFADSIAMTFAAPPDRAELARRVVFGGYPEIQGRSRVERRGAWFDSYLSTLLQRDAREQSAVADLSQLPRLLTLLASRLGGTVAVSDLSRTLGIPHSTLTRYLGLLEALFLIHRVPAWSTNTSSRLAKAPKLYLTDTGLAAQLLGLSIESLTVQPDRLGPLFEAFVVGEILKQIGWSQIQPRLYQFRTQAGQEVDLVLEAPGGRCVGIEIKLAATITGRDLNGLRSLAEIAGPRFHRGIVLYTGQTMVPFAENLHAVPVSALWQPALIGFREP